MPDSATSLARALLALARPQLDPLSSSVDHGPTIWVITLAQLAWNAVVMDVDDPEFAHASDARTHLAASTSGLERERMLVILDALLQRKLSESPMDMRLIEKVEFLENDSGELGIQVEEMRSPQRSPRKRKPRPQARRLSETRAGVEPEAHALYHAVKLFHELAPWRWMQNADVFGVRDPLTGEIGWCSVMGAGGELFGLAVYRGDEGYAFLRRSESGDLPNDEVLFGQPALVLAFLDRAELSKANLALIRSASASFRGAGNWPQIESHAANRLPLPPEPSDVRFLREVLEQVLEVAPRLQAAPGLTEPDAQGRLLVRSRSEDGADGEWRDARCAPPSAREAPAPPFDRVRAERIRRTLPRAEFEVECDLFPVQAIIAEPGKPPHAPAAFLVVHAQIGTVLRMAMTEPAGREAWAVGEFLSLLEELGGVPATILVMRASLARLLGPAALAVGTRVELVEHLRSLEHARAMLQEFTARGH